MTSNPIEILSKIRQAGGTISVLDGDLQIQAPAGTLDDQDQAVLVEYKDRLVDLLAPLDPEREAIQWEAGLDAGDQQQIVTEAIREWDRITGTEPVVDEMAERIFSSGSPVHISTVIKEVFASLGIEAEVEEVTQ